MSQRSFPYEHSTQDCQVPMAKELSRIMISPRLHSNVPRRASGRGSSLPQDRRREGETSGAGHKLRRETELAVASRVVADERLGVGGLA